MVMRIGIDITSLAGRRTGVGHYTYYLLKHLLRLTHDPGAPKREFIGFASGLSPVVLDDELDEFPYRRLGIPTRLLYRLWSTFGAPKVDALLGGVDVFHATNYFLPPTQRARRVVTIHDLAVLTMPEVCSPKIRRVFGRNMRAFAADADAILTCSEATKGDIVRLLDVAPEKITVAHHGPNEDLAAMNREHAAQHIKERYEFEGPYILFVGTLEPRKNIPGLLRAFSAITGDIPHSLILAGGLGWQSIGLYETIAQLGLRERVRLTNYIDDIGDLAALHSAADAFVFPSLYEGFGLPLLDAMACGTPILAANNSAIPEVVGDAALLIDANDQDALAEAIKRMLGDEALRESLVAKGHERVRDFSWTKCAEKTMEAYTRVVG